MDAVSGLSTTDTGSGLVGVAGCEPTAPRSHSTPEPRAPNRDFDKLRVRAGLPGVRLHDLRHTVVSLLLSLGTPQHVVHAIARHADTDVTMAVYAHPNPDEMRQALDAIEWEAG